MNLRKLLVSSLLLSIGLMLHQITPPFLMGMKPDFLLSMMFIAIMFADDYKLAIVIGMSAGILTAMTTTFPAGQLPNIIDKILTCNVIFILNKVLGDRIRNGIKIIIISLLGTVFSGLTFLLSALFLVGLPAPFLTFIITVVLPASLLNTVFTSLTYNALSLSMKRANVK